MTQHPPARLPPLHKPWLVAVWPGMGHVAGTAGYYLMSKLGMYQLDEFEAEEFYDVEQVEVDAGLIRAGRLPRNRLFAWRDPQRRHDILVFIGEAQPSRGKYAFCKRLIAHALELGVERVFTFAAMATQMRPDRESRVFGAATDGEALAELQRAGIEILANGHVSGLNGVLLGAAAEQELRGVCLLGEMPHIFTQLPFPKASLAVLRVFAALADLELDLDELADQAREVEQRLGELLANVEQQMRGPTDAGDEPPERFESDADEPGVPPESARRIEQLFAQATQDRAKAYELKRLLDELGLFGEYEDRFLDLFRGTDQ